MILETGVEPGIRDDERRARTAFDEETRRADRGFDVGEGKTDRRAELRLVGPEDGDQAAGCIELGAHQMHQLFRRALRLVLGLEF